MSRKRSGLQNPGIFNFETSRTTGRYLRKYCFENDKSLGEALEEALIDYLIKVKVIKNRKELEIEESLNY